DKEYVGFATLPNQVHRKSVKRGFDFTLMVAGESGLGKSTLVDSLFLTDLYSERKILNAEGTAACVCAIRCVLVSAIAWTPIARYINEQFEQYFRDESGLNRKNIQDNRVHCLLYFISPCGHGLRPIDVEFLKAVHDKVNIVPVIAKSDTLTPREVKNLKQRVRDEIEEFGITIYQFPDCDSDEDEEFKQQDTALKVSFRERIGKHCKAQRGLVKHREAL
ncbi:UNVERIFIED_CONTAM: hypothetical protein FKN15_077608, partial [Acipenser sinensis]